MEREIRFSQAELTGRSRGHIVDLADPPCSLHWAVIAPFEALRAAARSDGIDLVPVSSFRDFSKQLAIWNGKHRGERDMRDASGGLLDARALDDAARVDAILVWSALPGASRHHWGTDFDVIDKLAMPAGYRPQLVPEEYAAGGVFARLGAWLDERAAGFGFYRPYTTWRGGVQPEPWHLSYAPVASLAMRDFSVDVLRAALAETPEMEARAAVASNLPAIYARYVANVDSPADAATSATRLA
jgi:LAS superfamily LD-carboxypeptidase LdcB